MVALGAARLGALRAGVASHDATCESSGPLSEGACDSVDEVKGVWPESGNGTMCAMKPNTASARTMESRKLPRTDDPAFALMRPTIHAVNQHCQTLASRLTADRTGRYSPTILNRLPSARGQYLSWIVGVLVVLAILAQSVPPSHHHAQRGLHAADCPLERLATARDGAPALEVEDGGTPVAADEAALTADFVEPSTPPPSPSRSRAPPQIA